LVDEKRPYDAEKSTKTGVKSPMKTSEVVNILPEMVGAKTLNLQLLIQFDAVLSATPLLLIDKGNTSLGRTHPMGPKEIPYAKVKVYMPLETSHHQ